MSFIDLIYKATNERANKNILCYTIILIVVKHWTTNKLLFRILHNVRLILNPEFIFWRIILYHYFVVFPVSSVPCGSLDFWRRLVADRRNNTLEVQTGCWYWLKAERRQEQLKKKNKAATTTTTETKHLRTNHSLNISDIIVRRTFHPHRSQIWKGMRLLCEVKLKPPFVVVSPAPSLLSLLAVRLAGYLFPLTFSTTKCFGNTWATWVEISLEIK